MPIPDKIRLAARDRSCVASMFPDNGGCMLNPLTIDSGKLCFHNCKIQDSCFQAEYESSENTIFMVRTGYDISAREAHHTIFTKMYIPSRTCGESRHFFYALWQGGKYNNCTFGNELEYRASKKDVYIKTISFLQSPEEIATAAGGSSSSSGGAAINVADITDRWFVIACTINGAASTSDLYLDGKLIYHHDFSDRGFDTKKNRRTHFRSGEIVSANSRFVQIGTNEPNDVVDCKGLRFAWGLMFDRIMTQSEIAYLSK